MNQNDHLGAVAERPPSRDAARSALKQVEAALIEASLELKALCSSPNSSKHIEYRYADAHIGQAMCSIELASIEMRKRRAKGKSAQAATDGGPTPLCGAGG